MPSGSDEEAQPSQTSQPSTVDVSPHRDGPHDTPTEAASDDAQIQSHEASSHGDNSIPSGGTQISAGEATSTVAYPQAQMTSIITDKGSSIEALTTSPDKIDQLPVVIPGRNSEISWKSHTLTIGGAAWTANDEVASAGSKGLVVRPASASASSETTVIPYTHISSAQATTSTAGSENASGDDSMEEQQTSTTSSESPSHGDEGQAQQTSTIATTSTLSSAARRVSSSVSAAFVLQLLFWITFS